MQSVREIWTGEKNCCRCKQLKPISQFSICKSRKDGLQPRCKPCVAVISQLRKPKVDSEERIRLNKERKYWRQTEAGKVATNRDIAKRTGNPEHLEYRRKRFRELKSVRENHNKYVKRRRQVDLMYRLIGNLRSRNRSLVKKIQQGKLNTLPSIGCSLAELKIHLEGKFSLGMSWDNYGKWHLDHIKPVSLAKSIQELRELNHYLNLQPLWGPDNISKSNKYKEISDVTVNS